MDRYDPVPAMFIEPNGKWYKADEVDGRVKKLKTDIEEAKGDSSLQLWYCEQFITEILQH